MVTLRAVIGRCAAVKIDVFTGAGKMVKACNGFRQRIGIDGAPLRQLGKGVSPPQIAGTQPGGRGERKGPGVAQAIAAQRAPIGQQPGLRRVARGRRRQQGGDKVVIGVGLVNKAFAVRQDGDHPGLGAFHQMRKHQLLAAGEGDAGHRRPGQRVAQAGIELAAGGFAKADPLALIVRRRGGEMAVTLRGMRHHLRQALPIVGKTAAGQHHGARFDEYLPAVGAQHCTGHSLRTLQQSDRRGVELKTHPGVEGGSQQTGDQRIAIDQMQPSSGAQPLPAVAQQAAGGIQRRARRAGSVEKMRHVRAAGDAHPGKTDGLQRRAQSVEPVAEQAAIVGLSGDRPPTVRRARRRVKVRHGAARQKLHRRPLMKKIHHFRSVMQEGLQPFVGGFSPHLMLQIGQRGIGRFVDALRSRQRVAGDPQPAAGPGAGPAEH